MLYDMRAVFKETYKIYPKISRVTHEQREDINDMVVMMDDQKVIEGKMNLFLVSGQLLIVFFVELLGQCL